jgi:hypothetical protein
MPIFKSTPFGTTANTFCQGNDSRISGIAGGSIITSNANQINLGVLGGSITSDGYGGNINTGGYGGSISTNTYGGTLDLSDHGGSITTGPFGGAINTTGQGSIGLGTLVSGGGGAGRTTILGSASGTDKTITLPNATGTIALTSDLQRSFQHVFQLGGDEKATFALNTSYYYGNQLTRGAKTYGAIFDNSVPIWGLRVYGNWKVERMVVTQNLSSICTATLTYGLTYQTTSGSFGPISSVVVNGASTQFSTGVANGSNLTIPDGSYLTLVLGTGSSGSLPISTATTTITADVYAYRV